MRAERPPMPEADVLAFARTCSNEGRWGPDDELGTLNLIDPATRLAALTTVRLGRAVSIGRDLDPRESAMNPIPVRRRMLDIGSGDGPGNAAYDALDIAVHSLAVTHLDAVAHMFLEGRIYNGRNASDVVTDDGLSFGSVYAQRDGILTRGVLLDVAKAAGRAWLDPTTGIYPEDLELAERLGDVSVRPGDAVFVRVGLNARAVAEGPEDPATRAGLMPECIPWFHSRDVAVYSGDCYDRVPLPYQRTSAPFHQIALASMGMTFLDSVDLEELSRVCAETGRYEFLLTVAPLRVRGGTGSPVNPICYF